MAALSLQYRWIAATAPILYHSGGGAVDIGAWLPEERVYRLVFLTWANTTEDIVAYHAAAAAARPQHRFHYLMNDPAIVRALRVAGLSSHFIHHNAFLDEDLYSIAEPEEVRSFDAIQIARFNPVKRHWLGKEVPRLKIVGALLAPHDDPDYLATLRANMPGATFEIGSSGYMPQEAVAAHVRTAHVGLCLSEMEGGLYAATEYLLSGLPIVSAGCCGGVSEWLRPEWSRIVPPDAKAVADAVEELKSLPINATAIRARALEIMAEHRRRFCELGQSILTEEGIGEDFARYFYNRFTHKMATWQPADRAWALLEELRREEAGG